jgi:hypothetical protein
MLQRSALSLLLFTIGCFVNLADAQIARPAPELVCHKEVCPVPLGSCQIRESERCEHGGGPPRCPAIVNVADGTSCSDANVCTTGDTCTAGVCGGAPVVCSSSTDTCSPSTGCATSCGPGGCVVAAAGGFLNPTLTVPPGALGSIVAITMSDLGNDPTNAAVYRRYSFGPAGTTFSTPATVDLPAPPLSPGQDVVIEVSDDGTAWSAIATTLNNGRVTGPISHFSFCRTRVFTPAVTTSELIITDMVNYQDLKQVRPADGLTIPPLPPATDGGTCYSGSDFFGLCVRITNPLPSGSIGSVCPTPTPNPAPAGCLQVHVVPWQCYTASRGFPAAFDPNNPATYQGQNCDFSGLLIPCAGGEAVYNLNIQPPLGPGASMWVDINFLGTPLARGTSPYSCFGSSFIGIDLLLREPAGTDWQVGIRSAKDGVCVEVPMGTTIFVKATPDTCNPGLPIGQFTCSLATCRASWDSLVSNNPANYPTLRCQRGTTAISCSQFQPGDVVYKNWLIDARF